MNNNKWSDFLVYNKGFLRWNYPNGNLIIFSDETNKSDKQLIDERCELQKDDKIIWIKDLPKEIKKEYLKQIERK